jgi:hypothetical protein
MDEGIAMTQLKVAMHALQHALQDHEESSWYLDVQTGEIIALVDPQLDPHSQQSQQVLENPERYVWIEPLTYDDADHILADFAQTLDNELERRAVQLVLEGDHPWRDFSELLAAHPSLRIRWFLHEDAAYRRFAIDRLQDLGVRAQLV